MGQGASAANRFRAQGKMESAIMEDANNNVNKKKGLLSYLHFKNIQCNMSILQSDNHNCSVKSK